MYEKIKREYNEFYKTLFKRGHRPLKDTSVGIWGQFDSDIYHELFRRIKLEKYSSFVDLGSGDGKVVLIASLFTKATGIEYDKELFEKSIEIRDKTGLSCKFINGDYTNLDLDYDLVFINPDKGFHMFEDKLIHKVRNLLVCNDIFLPRFFEKGRTEWIDEIPFTFYINPNILD